MALIGKEVHTNDPVGVGEVERRSSLYVLGKPGTGKSTLLLSLLAPLVARRVKWERTRRTKASGAL
jgi:KaiC/GvpD/RAD55 family RecA-like ATPase